MKQLKIGTNNTLNSLAFASIALVYIKTTLHYFSQEEPDLSLQRSLQDSLGTDGD